ncbi:alginate export family protein [Alteromonas antoniana]|uniref:alginate export family protein n=1 Tax=Alteromonas antoniana TaxID=2803813 RepID=UPI001C459279|nr:alginate export family protein [Alteromonas antoniana]
MSTSTRFTLKFPVVSICVLAALCGQSNASELVDALAEGSASASMNLRYESVSQDNAVADADALTLRTFLGLKSGSYKGFSVTAEVEDSRIVLGQGDYSVGPTGYNVGQYSVIADPETTELDQAFVQYQSDSYTVRAGRQVIALDAHRFVGHVGWRQDRQTFDGISLSYQISKDISAFYAYVNQRNRIFAQAADLDSKDHLINISYQSPVGKFTAYSYLLEIDNATPNSLDTFGVRYAGGVTLNDVKYSYTAEYATQSSETATLDVDASYWLLEGSATFSGVTLLAGYEVLGSDEGVYGFSTPLATLHKFNGWADQFLSTPAQGLKDAYISLSSTLAGGKGSLVYHQFDADESSVEVSDLGSEVDLVYTKAVLDNVTLGLKYARYSAGDINVDTDKLWAWVSTAF